MVSKVEKENFARYLAEAKSWETDKVRSLEKSRKLAWVVASFAGLITVLTVMALAMLTPLKTAVPYVLRVDSATGAVDVVSAMTDTKTNYNKVMNKYNVQWYVRWREGYSKSLISEYYNNVGLTSSQQEQARYSQWISKNNPSSPLNVYGELGSVKIKIKSTSFLKNNVALVRYTKEVSDAANNGITHWAATIVFEYAGTPMSEQDRAVNPLGFQVLEYRNDPDQPVDEGLLPSNLMQKLRLPEVKPIPAAPAVPAIQ